MNLRFAMGLIGWLVVTIAVVALLWLARRKGWTLTGRRYPSGRFLPSSAPSASRTARVVDAAVLGASGAIIIAIAATWRSTGGLMLMLDELQPQYATANIIMFVCAVVGAAVAVLITLLGRTVTVTITMAVVLIGYGLVLNGGDYPGSHGSCQSEWPSLSSSTPLTSADRMWRVRSYGVNGLFLGKTPYRTTLAEFEAEVPYRPQPPADYETDKVEIPQYSCLSTWNQNARRWIRFELPCHSSWGRGAQLDQVGKAYYATCSLCWRVGLGGRRQRFRGEESADLPSQQPLRCHLSRTTETPRCVAEQGPLGGLSRRARLVPSHRDL